MMDSGDRRLERVKTGLLGRESVFLCPAGLKPRLGEIVVTSRSFGLDWGRAVGQTPDSGQGIEGSILRPATEEDLRIIASLSNCGADARIFQRLAEKCGLKMKLAGVDHSFDFQRITFYFLSNGRVDFRELVRLLKDEYNRKVDLFQLLSLPDQLGMIPLCGICGKELCCKKIRGLFDKNIPAGVLLDQKIAYSAPNMTGWCGEIRCCYAFEHCNYAEFAQALPRLGCSLSYRGLEFVLADWDIFRKEVVLSRMHENKPVFFKVPWQEFKTCILDADAAPLSEEDILKSARKTGKSPRRSLKTKGITLHRNRLSRKRIPKKSIQR